MKFQIKVGCFLVWMKDEYLKPLCKDINLCVTGNTRGHIHRMDVFLQHTVYNKFPLLSDFCWLYWLLVFCYFLSALVPALTWTGWYGLIPDTFSESNVLSLSQKAVKLLGAWADLIWMVVLNCPARVFPTCSGYKIQHPIADKISASQSTSSDLQY